MGDFGQGDALPLRRELSSQSHEYAHQFDMSPEAVAVRAAAERERSRIATEVAARSPGPASASDSTDELQFKMDGAGKKRTKKRAVRRKRTYKKSKRSYKKSKRSYKKSKRGGATAPMITFNIVKGNSDDLLLEVQLEPTQTGKDLYERVTEWLDQHPDMLTDAEKVGQRKLVTDNDIEVIYTDMLSKFQPRTKLILSIIPEGSGIPHGRGLGLAPAPAGAGA
jgi:hypothetical protein